MNTNNIDHPLLLEKFPRGVIALDLEMTGLSPLNDHIIEIGAIKVTPNVAEAKIFDQLVSPPVKISSCSKASSEIHGITDQMVLGQPKLEVVLPKLFEFVGTLPIIAHNAKFDVEMLGPTGIGRNEGKVDIRFIGGRQFHFGFFCRFF